MSDLIKKIRNMTVRTPSQIWAEDGDYAEGYGQGTQDALDDVVELIEAEERTNQESETD